MNKWRYSRINSFKNAWAGIVYNLKNEPNFLIHFVFAVLVVTTGFILGISRLEWAIVLLCIGAVISTELLNTSVEKLCDRFMNMEDPVIKIIKDSAAAAVLLISLIAALIGILVFLPYFLKFFQG